MIGNIKLPNTTNGNSDSGYIKYTDTWFTNFANTAIFGDCVWKDINGDIYYSYDDNYYGRFTAHYIYDKVSHTWSNKTWNNIPSGLKGNQIWTDGSNIYYSGGSSGDDHYVLDKSISTWNTKTWNWSGWSNSLYGQYIWTDGTNIYYSSGPDQYILDISTSTWNEKTWNGLTNFSGDYIWTDGTNIYYSSGSSQYVLDKSTSTWNPKTWNNQPSSSYFDGRFITRTKEGDIIWAYSDSNVYYKLDRSTSTWISAESPVAIWSYYSSNIYLSANYIWHDDIGTYYDSIRYVTGGYQVTEESVQHINFSYFKEIYKK